MTPELAKKTITVLGCGYVGLTTAAILANCGFKVYAVETDPKRLAVMKKGQSFFHEAGINSLLANGLSQKTLIVTNTYKIAILKSGLVFSCVGTPDNPDGSSNLSYIFDAASQAAEYMKVGTIFVQKSTVPVGTGKKIEKLFKDQNKSVHYVSNPEFLREGTAIIDTLWSDRIVVGSENQNSTQAIIKLYKKVESERSLIAELANIKKPRIISKSEYIQTGLDSAELIKITSNAFLALKISFANSIAKLADQAGADITEVMDGVGADRRIGRAFLNAGRGYGGGCFPKDVSGLIRSAEDYGVNMEIMNAATEVNDSMPHYIINRAKNLLGGSYKNKEVAVLGLAFKPGTSDVRRSPAIAISNTLAEQGAKVRAYDPEATDEIKEKLNDDITLCNGLDEAIKNTSSIFIATDWPEFKKMNLAKVVKLSKAELFVDCVNCLNKDLVPKSVKYLGVGKSS